MNEMTPDKFYAETLGRRDMSEMTPVDQFRALAKKAEADAEAMQGFPGSRYPARIAREGLKAIVFLEARIKVLTLERDLAIAHDRQPYPTVTAYEAVCAARTGWQDRAQRAEARIEALEKDIRWLASFAARQEPWNNDEDVREFNRIVAALAAEED